MRKVTLEVTSRETVNRRFRNALAGKAQGTRLSFESLALLLKVRMLVKKTSKNQLTVPKKIADRFPGTEYFDVQVTEGAIILCPVQIQSEDDDSGNEAIRDKVRRRRLKEKDVAKAVGWARRNKFIGKVESDVPDLGEAHREHLRRRFRRD